MVIVLKHSKWKIDYLTIWEVVAVLIVSQPIDYLGGSFCFGFVSINQLTIWKVDAVLIPSQSINWLFVFQGSRNDDILHEIERLSKDLYFQQMESNSKKDLYFSQMETNDSESLKEGTNNDGTVNLLGNNNMLDARVQVFNSKELEQNENHHEAANNKLISLLETNKEPLSMFAAEEDSLNLLDCLSNTALAENSAEENIPTETFAQKDKSEAEAKTIESDKSKSLSSQILSCDGISLPRRQLLLSLLTCKPCKVVCKDILVNMTIMTIMRTTFTIVISINLAIM